MQNSSKVVLEPFWPSVAQDVVSLFVPQTELAMRVLTVLVPQTELAMRGSYGFAKGALKGYRSHSSLILMKKLYLVTPALSSNINIYIENRHFLVQVALRRVGHQTCQLRAWKPGVLSQDSSARSPQPGVLSQTISVRNPQPGVLIQDSSARKICLGSALES